MSMHFEDITKETLYIALEIVNSNPKYNLFENGYEARTLLEIEEDFLNPETNSAFIKLDDTYIGVIDFLIENPKDHYSWLGLLMIHSDYQGFGYGTQAYTLYEEKMLEHGVERVLIGVIKGNSKDNLFWEILGFQYIKTAIGQNGKEIFCYEKIVDKKTSRRKV